VLYENLYCHDSTVFSLIPAIQQRASEDLFRKIKQFANSTPVAEKAAEAVEDKQNTFCGLICSQKRLCSLSRPSRRTTHVAQTSQPLCLKPLLDEKYHAGEHADGKRDPDDDGKAPIGLRKRHAGSGYIHAVG